MVLFGFFELVLARRTEPSQMPGPVALSNALIVAPARDVDLHDARAVVAPAGSEALVRVGGEETGAFVLVFVRVRAAIAVGLVFERDVDSRTIGLKTVPARGRLCDRTSDLVSVLVQYHDVRRHRIRGRKLAAKAWVLVVVAATGQAAPRLQHQDLEVVLAADERDRDREVQVLLAESLDLEAVGQDNVFAVAGIVVDDVCLAGSGRVSARLRLCHERVKKDQESDSTQTSERVA